MKRFICLLILVLTAFASIAQSVCRVAVDSLMFRIDTTDYWLKTYTPDKDSWFSFVRTKPATTDSKIGLCIVAAFTSKAPEHIVGTNICAGKASYDSTESETGYCLLGKDFVEIGFLNEGGKEAQERAINEKLDYFQQILLLKDGKAIPTEVFRNRTTARRALAMNDSVCCIVETDDRMHIDDFTACISEMGFRDAIYLDVGSWSKGWCRDKQGRFRVLGKNHRSTHLQTNWILIKKTQTKAKKK